MVDHDRRTNIQIVATVLELAGGALLAASVWLPFSQISGAGPAVTRNGFAEPGFLGWPILVTGVLALIAGTAALIAQRQVVPVPLLGLGSIILVGFALLAVLPDKHASGLVLLSDETLWHKLRGVQALNVTTGFGIKIATAGSLLLLAACYPDLARLAHRSPHKAS
ncbi:MAG: hypothetical protein J7M25_06390 [Deltaproteobacteria bacterium]|nr:hypothetical protein [Deltaproteobacteria bacterium]